MPKAYIWVRPPQVESPDCWESPCCYASRLKRRVRISPPHFRRALCA